MSAASLPLCFFPPFRDPAELADAWFKLCWYMAPVAGTVTGIGIPLADNLPREAAWPPRRPDYLAAEVEDAAALLQSRARPFAATDRQGWAAAAPGGTLFFTTDIAEMARVTAADPLLADIYHGRRSINVDRHAYPHDGYVQTKAMLEHLEESPQLLDESRHRFTMLAERVRASGQPIHLIGSGPGLDHARQNPPRDGAVAICNSILTDQALLDELRPDLVFLVDAVLHAGAIGFAGRLRAALRAAMERFPDLILVTRIALHPYLATGLPDHARARVIALPVIVNLPLNLDLVDRFYVKEQFNVLTTAMLPVAASLSDTIRLIGFDGRRPGITRQIWSYDPRAEPDDLMATYRAGHPALFNRDPASYEDRHADLLASLLDAIEGRGHRVVSLTPSWIPAIARRGPAPPPAPPPAPQ